MDDLIDGIIYEIEVIAGMHDGIQCYARWDKVFQRFDAESFDVPFDYVKIITL